MRDFIERLKAKPEHIRRRIAVGTAVGVTGVVTVVWFFGLLFGGNLSLAIPAMVVGSNGTLAEADANGNEVSVGNTGNLAGAGASNAFGEVPQQSNFAKLLAAVGISTAPPAPAALQVEDEAPTSTATSASPTVIPF